MQSSAAICIEGHFPFQPCCCMKSKSHFESIIIVRLSIVITEVVSDTDGENESAESLGQFIIYLSLFDNI